MHSIVNRNTFAKLHQEALIAPLLWKQSNLERVCHDLQRGGLGIGAL